MIYDTPTNIYIYGHFDMEWIYIKRWINWYSYYVKDFNIAKKMIEFARIKNISIGYIDVLKIYSDWRMGDDEQIWIAWIYEKGWSDDEWKQCVQESADDAIEKLDKYINKNDISDKCLEMCFMAREEYDKVWLWAK
jgi:hypothetical protein